MYPTDKTVVVGMSGGVDSSVAAYLLKEQGYSVIGVTMHIWQDEDPEKIAAENGCCGLSAVEDARRVSEIIGIPHYVMDFRKEFQQNVIDYFSEEYIHGRTPNPCIACNRYVKWGALLKRSAQIGASFIATGHYAGVELLKNGRYSVRRSESQKDQTYALFNLTQDQLRCTLMPLGGFEKASVREIAERAGLPVSQKRDSQEICFIPDHDHASFIERERGKDVCAPGNFISADGQVLGRHKGIIHYTIGQRRGLNLPVGRHIYVTGIRPETNEVVLGYADEVFSESLEADCLNFMSVSEDDFPVGSRKRLWGKIRYRHEGEWCMVTRIDADRLEAVFEKPVRAVTPGQAAVFYDGDYIFAGGTICS